MRPLMLTALFALASCAPKYSGLPPMAPSELYVPLNVEHVVVDGADVGRVDVAYVDSGGEGPVLLFVHGLSSTMGFWEYQLPPFVDGYRVVALDLPGYGASGRPDAPYTPPWFAEVVVGLMDSLELETATLVGHSMGGQIALTMALDHPERVDAIALSAPAGIERFEPGHGDWMKAYWHEQRALGTPEEELRTTFTTLVFNNADAGVERMLEERVRMGQHPSFEGTAVAVSRSIAGMIDFPVADRLGQIDCPTLIVFGTHDRMIPNPIFNGGRTATVARQGQEAIPGSELVLIPRAGHTVHHDAPEAFNGALRRFLESQ